MCPIEIRMQSNSMTQQDIIDSLPSHLIPFVARQNYSNYSPRDQAVWRFVMKHLTRQLAASAHPVYLEGLQRTGIALDQIPSIEEMKNCLAKLGWRAVVVDGFIPPAIFMEFQALRVLVIAVDMRSVEHIFYTPAPDIVHESAGHAPFLVDIDYAEFLQSFGEVGMKAISTKHDLDQYEAIRKLSILKESPDTSEDAVRDAEQELGRLSNLDIPPSEAALLTRLHWWTVEYGLVGEVEDYRIFGAGLLSSLSESRHCLNDVTVDKLPLTVNAVLTPYDITREQPQLFVSASCKHLSQVLDEFAESMCFRNGGARSLQIAIDAKSVCTAVYKSDMQVSGIFEEVTCDAVGNPTYLRTTGPTQLAYKGREIIGHGIDYHSTSFGSPIGHLKKFSRCLSLYTIDELKAHNIAIGELTRLEYLSGVTVEGVLEGIHRQEHRNLILSFSNCTVTDLCGRVLFDPAWGSYDLAVGSAVTSVYGGVADREKLQLHKPTSGTQTLQSEQNEKLMSAYRQTALLNSAGHEENSAEIYNSLLATLAAYPNEWLLRVEMLKGADKELAPRLESELLAIAQREEKLLPLIQMALDSV
jgi:phenylalanine-4-hydroxylase